MGLLCTALATLTTRTEVVIKRWLRQLCLRNQMYTVTSTNRSLAEYLISLTPVSGFVYVGVPAFSILIDRYKTGILQ